MPEPGPCEDAILRPWPQRAIDALHAVPVVTLRLLGGPVTPHAVPPAVCRVEVGEVWLELMPCSRLDALLHERAVAWCQHNDWSMEREPVQATEDVDGVLCRTATFTVRGSMMSDARVAAIGSTQVEALERLCWHVSDHGGEPQMRTLQRVRLTASMVVLNDGDRVSPHSGPMVAWRMEVACGVRGQA